MTRSLDSDTQTVIAAATSEKVKLIGLNFESLVMRLTPTAPIGVEH